MLTATAGPALRRGLLGAAVSIAVVTVAARAVGFLRTVVFARVVGATCLGSTYYTANTVPNVVFEIVAGGALASAVVPVLAGPVARADAVAVRRTAGALLTWTVLLLTPLALAVLVFAGPIVGLLVGSPSGGCARAEMVAVGGRMLAVFAPQVVLYGVGVVLTGVLQAHRRFVGPALAPLLSSLVVVAAYLTFGLLGADADDLAGLPRGAELVLSVGTTLGVVALSLSLLLPVRATGISLRPALRFPPGVAPRVRALAVAGAATLAAQQVSVVVVLRLANDLGPTGAAALYTFAWTVFLLPWAVLAVPLATSAFPELSARAAARDEAGFADTAAATTRAVLLVAFAAAALLVATATPIARVLVLAGPGGSDPAALAATLRAFAPGLVGYALVAHLGRALYARGAAAAATTAIVAGWAAVVVADLALVPLAPLEWRVAALGLGNSLGMTLAGGLLLAAVARAAGRGALRGTARAAAAGVTGAAGGAAAGSGVAAALAGAGVWASAAAALAVAAVTVGGFAAGALLVDRGDLLRLLPRSLSPPLSRGGPGTADRRSHVATDLRGLRVALVLGTSSGGIGRHVRALVPALLARGARVAVLGPAATDELFGFAAAGARFAPVEIAEGPGAADPRAIPRLRRLLGGADVVHAHGLRAGLLAGLVHRGAPPALVVTWHNRVLGGRARRASFSLLERRVARRADVTLGASPDLVARARTLGAADARFAPVAAAALPPPRRTAAQVHSALGAANRPLVLAVGRLHPQKGFDTLVAAAARWARRTPPPLVAIAGDGPSRAALDAAVAATAAPVRLLGRRDDVADLLAAAAVVVLPSVWEARPLVVQEALRAGRPLVATAVGGVPELVGDAAVLVPPAEPDALSDAVTRLLDDPAAARALAARGPARAARWPDEEDTAEQVAAVYRELCR